jgi:hypothetical protein
MFGRDPLIYGCVICFPAVAAKVLATFFLSDLRLNLPHMAKPRECDVWRTRSFPYSPATYKKMHQL